MNFENQIKKLEEIVNILESGEKSLEETIKLYEQGREISSNCKNILNQAKEKIVIINNNNLDQEI